MEGLNGITVIDIIIAVIFAYFIIRGFEQGFIDQTSRIFGLLLGLLVGINYYDSVLIFLEPYFDLPSALFNIIGFLIVFAVVNAVIFALGRVIRQIFDFLFLGIVDNVAGAGFGFLKGGILVFLLVFILNEIPYQGLVEMIESSYLAQNILQLTPVFQQNLQEFFGHS